ncbi:MAG TPA: YafY family protein [Thermoanaerobaculia bacterium]|jgi:predicted DNA-binding transcriptional regulator YafY|nr:YafY family protein [Thermoanaerobaculia bacterium]
MRRADRLFQIILALRRRRVSTARDLAQALEVSERTIYRDVQELSACGVPIEGAAGVGYRLRRGFDLPPLMFDREELQALRLGARMVRSWADPELSAAAANALRKIETVLPADLEDPGEALYALNLRAYPVRLVGLLRRAVTESRKARFDYTREDGAASIRTVWPLGLFYWGAVWTLVAWCEMRNDHRNFRLDRMANAEVLAEPFTLQPEQTLQEFLKKVGAGPL